MRGNRCCNLTASAAKADAGQDGNDEDLELLQSFSKGLVAMLVSYTCRLHASLTGASFHKCNNQLHSTGTPVNWSEQGLSVRNEERQHDGAGDKKWRSRKTLSELLIRAVVALRLRWPN